jgi:hypothetical protein
MLMSSSTMSYPRMLMNDEDVVLPESYPRIHMNDEDVVLPEG